MPLLLNDGIYPALWSPTDPEGRLLSEELRSNLGFLCRAGIDGVLALGTTGEFLRLETAERKRILEKIIEFSPELPVIANISHIRLGVVEALGKHAQSAGAVAVAVLPPYFYPMAQEDLAEFFIRAAEAARLPLVLYNFPERTGLKIELETIAAVVERVPVTGFKNSGADVAYHKPLVQLGLEKKFSVFTGSDTLLADLAAVGIAGCFGGLVNVVPEFMIDLLQAFRRGDHAAIPPLDQKLKELGRRIDKIPFPLNIAAGMEARGFKVGSPKTVVSSVTRARYEALHGELVELFTQWRLPKP